MEALSEWAKRTMRMRDDEGRPLGESKAPAKQLRGVPLELRTCPYAGSRHNHAQPMNVSALEHVIAHWEEALAGISLVRSLYCTAAKRTRLRLIDVWRIGWLTTNLADFAFLREGTPFGDGDLPAAVAVVYKATLGITFSCARMWSEGAARFDDFIDAEALYSYADRHDHFIGPSQVCAGPVAMIKEILRLVVDGGGRQGDASATAAVIGDRQRFLKFSQGAAALSLLRMALNRMDAGIGFDLAAALAADPAAPALSEAVQRSLHLARAFGLDTGARLEALDELLAHAGGPRVAIAGVRCCTRAISAAGARPLEDNGAAIRRIVAASPRARQWSRPSPPWSGSSRDTSRTRSGSH
jgi:hypothetical protein